MRGIASVLGVQFAGPEKPAAADPETTSQSDQEATARFMNANVLPFDRLPVVIQKHISDYNKKKKANGNQ